MTPEKFWTYVDKSKDCWLWKGHIGKNGYAQIQINGKQGYVHRIAYTLVKGDIPEGLFVCHKCDVRHCCNPDHLFVGTTRDNALDMMSKGRGKYVAHYGEDNGFSRLTENQVIAIRELAATGRISWSRIAEIFNVSKSAVMAVITRRNWKHIE